MRVTQRTSDIFKNREFFAVVIQGIFADTRENDAFFVFACLRDDFTERVDYL